jgi:hypothetical protein
MADVDDFDDEEVLFDVDAPAVETRRITASPSLNPDTISVT